ncbi:hypothetical protein F542_13730 [Bibersteinia trehalosi USDA-ARS-USMARC-188]|uniref:Uncharacterized protein n=1 Tax=Bibersteinia trehalosi USDA-ARS-USMARC-188 TaxID=1263829 RepID=A0A4V7IAT4_BIBTR|nr:hypothetical protein F542_13730 [Bibersteinia trehalosi USDA-ARS-USMARC-188]
MFLILNLIFPSPSEILWLSPPPPNGGRDRFLFRSETKIRERG